MEVIPFFNIYDLFIQGKTKVSKQRIHSPHPFHITIHFLVTNDFDYTRLNTLSYVGTMYFMLINASSPQLTRIFPTFLESSHQYSRVFAENSKFHPLD